MNLTSLQKDLQCFGSLEGMKNVSITKPTQLSFCKNIFGNFIEYRHIIIDIKSKELSSGAVQYKAVIKYVDDRNKPQTITTPACYSDTSLRDAIIVAQKSIF